MYLLPKTAFFPSDGGNGVQGTILQLPAASMATTLLYAVLVYHAYAAPSNK